MSQSVEYMEIMKMARNANRHYKLEKAKMLMGFWKNQHKIKESHVAAKEFDRIYAARKEFLSMEFEPMVVEPTLEEIKNHNFLQRMWEKLCHIKL